MKKAATKADLFNAMGLGPVWELKQAVSSSTEAEASIEETPSIASKVATDDLHAASVNPVPESLSKPASFSIPVSAQAIPDLGDLREQVAACRACVLCESRKQTVFSDGVVNAPLMVIGEAPGADEDATGLPFVGRAGQLLDKMLQAVGSSRQKDVYIANVIKCRPPGNRNPEAEEISSCSNYLFQQVLASQPKVLLLVGKFAIQTLLNSKQTVGELRGKVHKVTVGHLQIPAVVTYHPAYLLRRPEEKVKAWDDLLLLKGLQF